MAPRRSRDDSDDSDGSGDDVDVDGDENERDAVKYDERGRRILADDIVAAIHQAHARGLTAPMLPPKRQMNQHRASVTSHRPGYSSVDARDGHFQPSNGDPNPQRGAAEASSKDAAAFPATSSSAPFPDPAKGWGGLGDFSDAVLNALAAKRLDKDKMTHGQRLEARLEARMRGGSVPRGDRGGHKDKQRRGSGESIGGDGDDDDFRDRRRADSRYTTDNSDDPTHDPTPSGRAIAQQRALPVVSARRRARRVGVRGGRSTRRRVLDSISSFTARVSSICGPVVESEDFELLVVIVILVNCVSLALYRPTEGTGSAWNTRLDRLELGLNGFFTLELVLRISHRSAREYFRDPWNRFDFALVLAGYSGLLIAAPQGGADSGDGDNSGLRALRALRALRPLRTITRFQSLRSVVVCFIEAVPLLVSVVGFVVYFTFLFAIAGHQLFQEAYHQRCEDPSTGVPETWNDAFGCDSIDNPQITGSNPAGSERGSGRTCPPFDELGNPLECVYVHSGRGNSVAGYDNVAAGMLTVFQCTTLAGWAQVMYRIMDSGSEVAVPYFVLLVFFGPYFVVNLFLAVLKTKFGKAQSLFQSKMNAVKGSAGTRDDSTASLANPNVAPSSSTQVDEPAQPDADNADADDAKPGDRRRRNTLALIFAWICAVAAGYAERRRIAAERKEDELALTLAAHEAEGVKSWRLEYRRKVQALREWCFEVQEHRYFNRFFLALIYLNTVVMAMEHHGMSSQLEFALLVTNFVFTLFFTVEVAIKITGMGFWDFWMDNFNRFDLCIVGLSIIEVLAIGGSAIPALRSLKALRSMKVLKTFRVFRIFKMFRYLASLRIIGEVILSSLGSFVSIAVLLFLFLLVFAIVGLHVFGGLKDPDSFRYGVDDPQLGGRASFDSFYHSLLLTFQVLTLEDWEFIMFKSIEYAGWGASVYFVMWVIVGKYTFLTLFLAVTMEAFESKYDPKASREARVVAKLLRKKRERRKKRQEASLRRRKKEKKKRKDLREERQQDKDGTCDALGDEVLSDDNEVASTAVVTLSSPQGPAAVTEAFQGEPQSKSGWKPKRKPTRFAFGLGDNPNGYDSDTASGASSGAMTPYLPSGMSSGAVTPGGDRYDIPSGLVSGMMTPSWGGSSSVIGSRHNSFGAVRSMIARRMNKEDDLQDTSCGCVPPHHGLRERCFDVVTHWSFDHLMFALIFGSCVAMAMERPDMEPELQRDLLIVDYVLTVCFAAESGLKVFVFGFRRYIRERTNQLDFFIVVTTLLELMLTSVGGLKAVRSLRILRAIRPLRALTKSSGMRLVLKSVALSIGAMVNVSVVMLMFFVIFGILGVQVFAGRFYRCNDPSVPDRAACVGSYYDPNVGNVAEREWSNAYLNFDNLYRALISLFVTSTLDGYGQIMFDALDITGIDKQPRMDHNPAAFVFFVAFIVLCAFSLLNLYVGVIFYQFSRIRMLSQTSSIDLTEEQKEWAEMCKSVLRMQPLKKLPPPKQWWRKVPFRVVSDRKFDRIIMAAICASVLVMSAGWHGEPTEWTEMKDNFNLGFTCVFIAEAALKIIAIGFVEYWSSSWNRFDLFLVCGSLVDLCVQDLSTSVVRLIRLFRVSRMFRLIKSFKGLKSLFETLLVSLPAFWNVGALVLLLFFIYSYVGVLTFGTVVRADSINEHANFESFPTAMLTLFRVATNDEWVGLMQDCSRPDANGSWVSYPYFISFVIAVSMIMLNLFTAVIIENFENTQDHEQWKLSPNSLEGYVSTFREFDDGTGTISGVDLERLLKKIPPPLGIGQYSSGVLTVHFIKALNVPLSKEGRVPFRRTAFELVRRVCECDMPPGEMRDRIEYGIRKAFPDIWEPIPDELSWSALMCVIRVQRHWREVTAARCERARLEKIAKKREKEEFSPKPAGRRMSLSLPTNPLTQLMRSRRSSRVAPDLTDHRSSLKKQVVLLFSVHLNSLFVKLVPALSVPLLSSKRVPVLALEVFPPTVPFGHPVLDHLLLRLEGAHKRLCRLHNLGGYAHDQPVHLFGRLTALKLRSLLGAFLG